MTTAAAPPAASTPSRSSPLAAGLLTAAWALLGAGLAWTNGAYAPGPLGLVVLGVVAVVAAGVAVRRGIVVAVDWRVWLVLAVLAAGAGAVVWRPGVYGEGAALGWSRGLGIAGAALALATVTGPRRLRTGSWAGVVGVLLVAGVLMIQASPRPEIDVWVMTTQAAEGLFAGENPFRSCWTDNTDPVTDCVYGYLPLTAVVQAPFWLLLGDVRFALLAAMALASVLVHRLAAPTVAACLAALVLLQPKWLFLIEQAWTEPLLLAALCLMVWGTLRGHTAGAVAGLALALAMKQHMVILVPLAAWWPAFGWRRTAIAVLAAAAAVGVFAVADPAAFFSDAVLFHLDLPLRDDSLSLYGAAIDRGWRVPLAVVPVATVAFLAGAMALPRTATGFVLGSAGVLVLFNLVNKHSFFNHYSLPLWLLVLGLALLSREGVGDAGGEAPAEGSPSPSGRLRPAPLARYAARVRLTRAAADHTPTTATTSPP